MSWDLLYGVHQSLLAFPSTIHDRDHWLTEFALETDLLISLMNSQESLII